MTNLGRDDVQPILDVLDLQDRPLGVGLALAYLAQQPNGVCDVVLAAANPRCGRPLAPHTNGLDRHPAGHGHFSQWHQVIPDAIATADQWVPPAVRGLITRYETDLNQTHHAAAAVHN